MEQRSEQNVCILVVDDEQDIRRIIRILLESSGYQVAEAPNGLAAVEYIRQQPNVDLVLMDITLPYFSGYYWCAEIRKISRVPIVFPASAADEMNQVMALSMGADDFIAKPFGMELATAKIGAVLRRAYDLPATSSQLHAGGAVLDLQEAALLYGGEKLSLSKNEFLILRILFEHKNSPVSREELIRALWNDESFIDDNTLTVNIARIRKKLEEAGLRDFIRTRKGLGYLIEEKEHD